ncbi:hypothetical protein BU16DRAFT_295577 [Lophium mytilinum]|uniref:Meiotically up-regulated protein Msb1/Mug8 domain-containing protein n=1 Tax=Lophium mytilinum TaxID=390894 RepID=A0A6A6R1U7_9PEZI|nr:hypothetical protein BU16DRAFT_295577 [Lophium mytilinum]
MPSFKNFFKSKDGSRSASKAGKYADHNAGPVAPPKPHWDDAWSRKDVAPEEIQELIHVCTKEMKSRALDMPFLLLPFRPGSDTSAARNMIRSFFKAQFEGSSQYTGEGLNQELRLTEPMVLCSIMKWCWSRLPGGVVTWDVYELFKIGESDSGNARHAFDTFIPLSVDSEARRQVIVDFFDLLSAIAARGKTNGLGGRKLSRMAGWWAFGHSDDGKGFDGGYKSWEKGADAASHLFFAYLRSLSPDSVAGISGISTLPRSLQALVSQTEYPPMTPVLMQTTTTRIVMIVDSVSPTPFALLRRAKNFEYRDDDEALQEFSSFEDPVKALTDECRRVLDSISSTNQSVLSTNNGMPDASWSRFEDFGFGGVSDNPASTLSNGSSFPRDTNGFQGLGTGARSRNTDFGRPTTPSWADFLSSGFVEENGEVKHAPLLLPPDKQLPPIGEVTRIHSSQSHMRNGVRQEQHLEPGELASITQFDLDETFWWVWMTSLAGEETTERKAVFGRCALIETSIPGARWLVVEEQVKGASPGPEEGAYIAEKKGLFSFTRRGRLGRRKSTGKKPSALSNEPYNAKNGTTPMSKTSIGPDQHARIQAAAARLAQQSKDQAAEQNGTRRGRVDDAMSTKTNSVMTLQPAVMSAAAPAMQWAKEFDKDEVRKRYLGDVHAGKGSRDNLLATTNGYSSPSAPKVSNNHDLPAIPREESSPQVPRKAPPPAPLPTTPTRAQAQSKKAEAASAAQVALPAATPTVSTPLDEKPAPVYSPGPTLDEHPALRKPVPAPQQSSSQPNQAEAAAKRAWENQHTSSPEAAVPAKKSPPKKLKKNTGGGGFRRMFGKKDRPAGSSDTPQSAEAEQGNGLQVPESGLGRRMSQLRKKPSPPVPAAEKSPAPSELTAKPEPVVAYSPAIGESPAVSAVSHEHDYSGDAPRPSGPRMTTYEQQEADHAFARFDQGPMDDMPAFVPDDASDEEHMTALPPPHFNQHAASHPASVEEEAYHEEEMPHPHDPSARDDISEQSIDLTRQASPAQDRWAQIRKNAAERAARLSEEQSRRSQSQSNRTDEGETSGEETIESRVARIKARVAELTGNMDQQGAPAKR